MAEKILIFKTWLLFLFYCTNPETSEWINHSWTKMGIILNKVYNSNILQSSFCSIVMEFECVALETMVHAVIHNALLGKTKTKQCLKRVWASGVGITKEYHNLYENSRCLKDMTGQRSCPSLVSGTSQQCNNTHNQDNNVLTLIIYRAIRYCHL